MYLCLLICLYYLHIVTNSSAWTLVTFVKTFIARSSTNYSIDIIIIILLKNLDYYCRCMTGKSCRKHFISICFRLFSMYFRFLHYFAFDFRLYFVRCNGFTHRYNCCILGVYAHYPCLFYKHFIYPFLLLFTIFVFLHFVLSRSGEKGSG